MHKLTIVFGPAATVWPLMFKTEESAKAALAATTSTPPSDDTIIVVTDDFSQQVHIRLSRVHGVMLEDLDVSRLAHIEHQMYVWRVQANAQQNAKADPVLRAAAAGRGPSVIEPQGVGMNGMGRF